MQDMIQGVEELEWVLFSKEMPFFYSLRFLQDKQAIAKFECLHKAINFR